MSGTKEQQATALAQIQEALKSGVSKEEIAHNLNNELQNLAL